MPIQLPSTNRKISKSFVHETKPYKYLYKNIIYNSEFGQVGGYCGGYLLGIRNQEAKFEIPSISLHSFRPKYPCEMYDPTRQARLFSLALVDTHSTSRTSLNTVQYVTLELNYRVTFTKIQHSEVTPARLRWKSQSRQKLQEHTENQLMSPNRRADYFCYQLVQWGKHFRLALWYNYKLVEQCMNTSVLLVFFRNYTVLGLPRDQSLLCALESRRIYFLLCNIDTTSILPQSMFIFYFRPLLPHCRSIVIYPVSNSK